MTTDNLKIEWVVNIISSLIRGRHTGGIQIWFKDGGISSITKPQEKKECLQVVREQYYSNKS